MLMKRLLQRSITQNTRMWFTSNGNVPRPDEGNDVNARLFNDTDWLGYAEDNKRQSPFETMPTVKKLDKQQHLEENEVISISLFYFRSEPEL